MASIARNLLRPISFSVSSKDPKYLHQLSFDSLEISYSSLRTVKDDEFECKKNIYVTVRETTNGETKEGRQGYT